MKRKRPRTHEVTRSDGRTVRVTVPEDPKAEDVLAGALRDNLSPLAVAAIASCLQTNRTNDPGVDREVAWFAEQLRQLVGGDEQQSQLADELGL